MHLSLPIQWGLPTFWVTPSKFCGPTSKCGPKPTWVSSAKKSATTPRQPDRCDKWTIKIIINIHKTNPGHFKLPFLQRIKRSEPRWGQEAKGAKLSVSMSNSAIKYRNYLKADIDTHETLPPLKDRLENRQKKEESVKEETTRNCHRAPFCRLRHKYRMLSVPLFLIGLLKTGRCIDLLWSSTSGIMTRHRQRTRGSRASSAKG